MDQMVIAKITAPVMENKPTNTGGIYMNNLGKALVGGAIFVAGYLVGFYEMKYKTMKFVLECELTNKEKEEGSQK